MRLGFRVTILTDYRGAFWSSTRNTAMLCSMNVERLVQSLEQGGCEVDVLQAGNASLAPPTTSPHFVLYTSSEVDDGTYKRFMESRVFGLEALGFTPVPNFHFLLAHHDKVFMETLRAVLLQEMAGQPSSHIYGSLEEFIHHPPALPTVLKPAAGAGSRGVSLARTSGEAIKYAKGLSRSASTLRTLREYGKRVLRRRSGYEDASLHLNAFVTQDFVPDLPGDFKVLRFGERLYAVARGNRPGDFRASGGGNLNYRLNGEDIAPVLDAAWTWSESLASPFASLDIGYDKTRKRPPVLIEFQCVSFGPAAIEHSTGYFSGSLGSWRFVREEPDYEGVFASAALEHFARHRSELT